MPAAGTGCAGSNAGRSDWTQGKGRGQSRGKSKGKGTSKGKGKGTGLRWVPKKKSSLLATVSLIDVTAKIGDVLKAIGGRVVELRTDSSLLGPLECLLIEPLGKRLDPKDFVTTGVIICFDGMSASDEAIGHWCQVVEKAGWLDAGASVAIPNVQMSSALTKADLEAVILALFDFINHRRCVLVGKGWGALRAVELSVGEGAVPMNVEGVILVAPGSSVPEATSLLEVPVLLIWSKDETATDVDEMEMWLQALDNRPAPTIVKELSDGGNDFQGIMACEEIAEVVKNFTVSSLLIANLLEEEMHEEQRIDSDDDEDPRFVAAGLRSACLTAQLPSFLRQDVESVDIRDGEPVLEAEHVRRNMDKDKRIKKRLSTDLPQWIQGGCVTAAE